MCACVHACACAIGAHNVFISNLRTNTDLRSLAKYNQFRPSYICRRFLENSNCYTLFINIETVYVGRYKRLLFCKEKYKQGHDNVILYNQNMPNERQH